MVEKEVLLVDIIEYCCGVGVGFLSLRGVKMGTRHI
jgi:hypothetical protein